MEPAYLSAFAALAGSVIGGLTSLTASWLTQRVQVNAQQLAHDRSRREDLYKDFIEQASESYVDAIEHTEVDKAKIVRLYSLVSRMRILASQRVVEQANLVMRLIMETYRTPSRTIRDEIHSIETSGLDPLLNFSEACREDLKKLLVVGPRPR